MTPGYSKNERGAWVGVLREGRRVVWQCSHEHSVRGNSNIKGRRRSAYDCARQELQRRMATLPKQAPTTMTLAEIAGAAWAFLSGTEPNPPFALFISGLCVVPQRERDASRVRMVDVDDPCSDMLGGCVFYASDSVRTAERIMQAFLLGQSNGIRQGRHEHARQLRTLLTEGENE